MKGKCKAHGGKVKEDNDMAGQEKEVKEGAAYKKGGKAHKKHGGKIEGKKPHERADKYKRGGHVKKHMKDGGMASKVKSAAGMSPMSPLSGAGKTAEPKAWTRDKEDD
jgi:hypothetical protein